MKSELEERFQAFLLDADGMQGLVAAGVAISLMPMLALTNLREDIVIRSLGPETPVRQVMAAALGGGYRSPAVAAMLEVLERAGREYLDGPAAITGRVVDAGARRAPTRAA